MITSCFLLLTNKSFYILSKINLPDYFKSEIYGIIFFNMQDNNTKWEGIFDKIPQKEGKHE